MKKNVTVQILQSPTGWITISVEKIILGYIMISFHFQILILTGYVKASSRNMIDRPASAFVIIS